jgi:hypothetical protein
MSEKVVSTVIPKEHTKGELKSIRGLTPSDDTVLGIVMKRYKSATAKADQQV